MLHCILCSKLEIRSTILESNLYSIFRWETCFNVSRSKLSAKESVKKNRRRVKEVTMDGIMIGQCTLLAPFL